MPELTRDSRANQQMMALKDVFRRTGAVHEIQRLNLRVWGELAVPHLKFKSVEIKPTDFEIVVDYESRGFLGRITNKPPENLSERMKSMADAVHSMFGKDYSLILRTSEGVLFTGERLEEPKPPVEYTGVDFEAGRVVPSKPWEFPKKTD